MASLLKGNLGTSEQRVIALIVIAGGVAGGREVRKQMRWAQKQQAKLCTDVAEARSKGSKGKKKEKVAVDKVFYERLLRIMRICVPKLLSKEALLILIQGGLLVSRTFLTDRISRIEARAGRHLIAQNFNGFLRGLAVFLGVSVPAALVNSGLRLFQKQIQLAFMLRLSRHLHQLYCSNRSYYSASVLGGLTNADQRITEDVEKFCFAVADLYSYTFKPLLDVLLFTRSLAKSMGYRPQLALYAYYLLTAAGLRAMSPPLALMTAQETGLAGAFRSAHQRLVGNAEEIAFNDPPSGRAEQMVLNWHLDRLVRHSRLSAVQRFVQQVFDGFAVKYMASAVALLLYAAPLYFRDPSTRGSQSDITQDYIRSMRLLQNTSRGVGDLVLVYRRVTGLAGHTSRVAELLEQVQKLSDGDVQDTTRSLYNRNVSSSTLLADATPEPLPDPLRHEGPIIQFHRVALNAPDGTPLVRELSFEVPPGRSVLVMGPNGSGKSSLFRVLSGLWPLQGGEITCPSAMFSTFYLSQRPYLVSGSLRDQILYPHPPAAVWATAKPAARAAFEALPLSRMTEDERDARLEMVIEAVELDYLLGRGKGWDQVQVWNETLSGGEKQRLAMARLLFHNPTYAILDECTSAVSADGEEALYRACMEQGITMLSIGHRPALRKYHQMAVHFDGTQSGRGWRIEELAAV